MIITRLRKQLGSLTAAWARGKRKKKSRNKLTGKKFRKRRKIRFLSARKAIRAGAGKSTEFAGEIKFCWHVIIAASTGRKDGRVISRAAFSRKWRRNCAFWRAPRIGCLRTAEGLPGKFRARVLTDEEKRARVGKLFYRAWGLGNVMFSGSSPSISDSFRGRHIVQLLIFSFQPTRAANIINSGKIITGKTRRTNRYIFRDMKSNLLACDLYPKNLSCFWGKI